jgi:hypothetical protein
VFEPPMWRALVIVNVIKTPTKKKHEDNNSTTSLTKYCVSYCVEICRV